MGDKWVGDKWVGDKWVEANSSRVQAVIQGLRLLLTQSWPDKQLLHALAQDHRGEDACHFLRELCSELNERYPTLRVFWKDEDLRWFGGCERFAQDAGARTVEEVIGLSDNSPGIPFQRQAAKYHRDDRRVMQVGHEYDIVERQDRTENIVVWLRTSKVAIYNSEGVCCGLVGGYDEVDEETVRRLRTGDTGGD